MQNLIRKQLESSITTLQSVMADQAITDAIVSAAKITATAMMNGHKLLVAGNGGSAAEAQHLVAEFVSRLTVDRPALRAVSLTVDTSILTAIGNDYHFDNIFERQVEALGQRGDVFLGMSTSANSPNLVKALKLSKQLGIATIGFMGNGGGTMAELCDVPVIVPSKITMKIQEAHLAIVHIFCMVVERFCFGDDFGQAAQNTAAILTKD